MVEFLDDEQLKAFVSSGKQWVTCTRRIEFDYGHRVMKHESKCRNVHGHRGVAEITAVVKTGELDNIGRVIDFSVLKGTIGEWIDRNWDHNILLNMEDEILIKAMTNYDKNKAPFLMNGNPTAENMAVYLLKIVCPELLKDTGVQVVAVRLYETPNCYAEAIL